MPPSERRAALAELRDAAKREDWAGVIRLGGPLLAREPWIPSLQYTVAKAEAALGRPDAARTRLENLAAGGLSLELAEEKAFAPLLATARGRTLAARLARNRAPAGRIETLHEFADDALLAEGLAHDAPRERWLVGDVHGRRILAINRAGAVTTLADRAAGLPGIFALRVDPARDRLWAAGGATPEMDGFSEAETGTAALFEFSLATGALLARHAPPDGVKLLGDLALGPDGAPWCTDSLGGSVLKLEGGALRAIIPAGRLHSPQGLAFSDDGARVWIADYRHGLFRYTPADGRLVHVAMKPDQWLQGLDAIARVGDRLIGVQNGDAPHRVVEVRLNRAGDRVRSVTALAANLPGLDGPTQGIPCPGGYCLIPAGHWPRFEPGAAGRGTIEATRIVRVPVK